ncbi:MAG: hypothetical protein FWG68_11255 [Defluviitaleaceae bacterium]|nr:hypothetical protein [Defluviitaleaceae bacterium]
MRWSYGGGTERATVPCPSHLFHVGADNIRPQVVILRILSAVTKRKGEYIQ